MSFVQEDMKGKTVTFIPTASVPEKIKFYVGSAKKTFIKMGLIVDELELTRATTDEITSKLRQNDYIYVSGGEYVLFAARIKENGCRQSNNRANRIGKTIHRGVRWINDCFS